MGDSNGLALRVGADRASAMGPAHALGLGSVDAIRNFALDAAAVAPALSSVLSTTRAAFDDAVLAAFLVRAARTT